MNNKLSEYESYCKMDNKLSEYAGKVHMQEPLNIAMSSLPKYADICMHSVIHITPCTQMHAALHLKRYHPL